MEESSHRSATREALIKLGYNRVSYTDKDVNNCYTETWTDGVNEMVITWGRNKEYLGPWGAGNG